MTRQHIISRGKGGELCTVNNSPVNVQVWLAHELQQVVVIEAIVTAILDDGSKANTYHIERSFGYASSVLRALGATKDICSYEEDASWGVDLVTDDDFVELVFTGDASLAVNWTYDVVFYSNGNRA